MFPASLLNLLVLLIFAGLGLWIVSQIPMDETIRKIIRVIVIVVCVVIAVYFLVGLLGGGYPLIAPAPVYPRR